MHNTGLNGLSAIISFSIQQLFLSPPFLSFYITPLLILFSSSHSDFLPIKHLLSNYYIPGTILNKLKSFSFNPITTNKIDAIYHPYLFVRERLSNMSKFT